MLTLAALLISLTGLTFAEPSPVVGAPPQQPTSVRVTWNPAPGCPPAFVLYDDLTRLSGGVLVAATDGVAEATATTTLTDDGYELRLVVREPEYEEERVLRAKDCATLARAAVLMTAVTLAPLASAAQLDADTRAAEDRTAEFIVEPKRDPTDDSVQDTVGQRPATSNARDQTDAAPTDRDTPPKTERVAPRRTWILVAAGPAIAITPDISATIAAETGWRWGQLALRVGGWHTFEATREVASQIAVAASVTAGSIGVRYTLAAGSVEVPVHASIEVGALVGGGRGERVAAQSTASVWLSASAGAGIAWPAQSRWALKIGADAVIPLARPGIHLIRGGERLRAFEAPPVGVRVFAGPVVRFL